MTICAVEGDQVPAWILQIREKSRVDADQQDSDKSQLVTSP